MRTVDMEWRHLDKEGATCSRCADTGTVLRSLVADLNRDCAARGIRFAFHDVRLGPDRIQESNMILLDGQPLEDLLPETGTGSSDCPSCSDLTGRQESCRTVVRNDTAYEVPPPALLREAACRLTRCCDQSHDH